MDCYDTGDCICKHGFDGSKCDKCKEGFTGNKCDECKPNITGHDCNQCKPNYFNYPLCQGMSQLFLSLKANLTLFFLSKSVYVTLRVRLLWTVMKTMAIALAKRDLPE